MIQNQTASPEVTVCIPAYQCESFIDETIKSVISQDYSDLRILISLDRSSDKSEEIIRRYTERDPRVELLIQHRRIGWADNVNFLLEQIRSPRFAVVFHDDLIGPSYISQLRARLNTCPDAINAFCFVTRFGGPPCEVTLPEFRGSTFERLAALLRTSRNATALPMRGLTDSSVLRSGSRLQPNMYDGYAADVLWTFDLATHGELVCVPEFLYQKRRHQGSVVRGWRSWPGWQLFAAEAVHARETIELIRQSDCTSQERLKLHALALSRYITSMNQNGRYSLAKHSSIADELLGFTPLLLDINEMHAVEPAALADIHRSAEFRSAAATLRAMESRQARTKGEASFARAALEDAQMLDPGELEVTIEQLHCLIEERRYAEAARIGRDSIIRYSTEPRLICKVARAFILNAEYGDACGCLDSLLDIHRDYAEAHYLRARALAGLRKRDEAKLSAQIAVSLSPERAVFANYLHSLESDNGASEILSE